MFVAREAFLDDPTTNLLQVLKLFVESNYFLFIDIALALHLVLKFADGNGLGSVNLWVAEGVHGGILKGLGFLVVSGAAHALE